MHAAQAIDSSGAAIVASMWTLGYVIHCRKGEVLQSSRTMRVRQAVIEAVPEYVVCWRARLRAVFSKEGEAKKVPV